MSVARVYGTVDGTPVIMQAAQGADGRTIWSVSVPLDQDGEYAVEVIAEDDAGNTSYLARMLYIVRAGTICAHMLPMIYAATLECDRYQVSAAVSPYWAAADISPFCPELCADQFFTELQEDQCNEM